MIRPHAFACTAGRRRPLNRALDGALASLADRLGRLRPGSAGGEIDFFWNRPSPSVVMRNDHVQQHVHFSPTVLLNVARPLLAPSLDVAAPAAVMVPRATTLAPALVTIERRVETRILDRTRSILRQTIVRRQPERPTFSLPPAAAAAPLQRLVVRTDAPVARAEMLVARTLPPPAAAPPGPESASPSAVAALSRAIPPSSPQVPALRLDRITAEVIRALDARLIARRERMGRS